MHGADATSVNAPATGVGPPAEHVLVVVLFEIASRRAVTVSACESRLVARASMVMSAAVHCVSSQGAPTYTQQLHALSLRRGPSRSGSTSGSVASAVKCAIAPPLAPVTARDTRACSGAPAVGHCTYAKTRA